MRRTAYEKGELLMIHRVIENEGHGPEELVSILGITTDELVERFADKLLENRELFLAAEVQVDPVHDDEEDGESDEAPEGSW
jgi:hypothetical protein